MNKDLQIFDLIAEERARQTKGIELIASEKTPQTLLILSDRNDELAAHYKEYGVEDIISFK